MDWSQNMKLETGKLYIFPPDKYYFNSAGAFCEYLDARLDLSTGETFNIRHFEPTISLRELGKTPLMFLDEPDVVHEVGSGRHAERYYKFLWWRHVVYLRMYMQYELNLFEADL